MLFRSQSPAAANPSSSTPSIPAPPRPLFEANEEVDAQPLTFLEWSYLEGPVEAEPAAQGGTGELAKAGDVPDPAATTATGSAPASSTLDKGKAAASSKAVSE